MDDLTIRALILRLSRDHSSGGRVIERAAILAAGTDSGAVLAWIEAHEGTPESGPAVTAGGGLHGARTQKDRGAGTRAPLRYVLPAGALA